MHYFIIALFIHVSNDFLLATDTDVMLSLVDFYPKFNAILLRICFLLAKNSLFCQSQGNSLRRLCKKQCKYFICLPNT